MALWTPAEIGSAVALWLDASDSTTITIDTGIGEWRDKSGNGRHPANTTDAAQPGLISAELNGLDIARFDGSNDSLIFPGSTATDYPLKFSTASFAVLAIIKPSALVATVNIFFGSRAAATGWFAGFGTNDPYFRLYADAEKWEPAPMTAITATTTWQSFVATAPRGATGKYRKNGTTLQSTTSAVGTQSLSNSLQVRLGSYVDASNVTTGQFNGDIAELLLYEGVITDDLIQLWEGYAHWKWGLQDDLAADHPYKSAAPTLNKVSGVVTVNGSPAARTVAVFLRSDFTLLGTTTSNATTGAFEILNGLIPPDANALLVTAIDSTGTYNAVSVDYITSVSS